MTNEIKKKIDNDYLFGCIKFKNNFIFYLMPVAYWILNHLKYDPNYNPNDWEFIFRDNILNVDDNNIEKFIQSIQVDKIDLDTVNFKDFNFEDIFYFFIDFDTKTVVNYFDEIEIEEYLPDENWNGKFDNPMNYLPQKVIAKVFPSRANS